MAYTTSSGLSGTTTAEGKFRYNPGDTVTFKIGALSLGEVVATGDDARITPIQIAESTSGLGETERQNVVTNLLVLLQSLDSDGDAANGITISTATAMAVTDVVAAEFDLKETPATFAADSALGSLAASAGGAVVDPDAALAHFKEQFLRDLAGAYTIDLGNNELIAFRINPDGSYLMAEVAASDESGYTGIERGRIVWNPQNGEIDLAATAANVTQDTNGEWGLSNPRLDERVFLSLDGGNMVIKVDYTDPADTDEELRLTRVANSSGLVGAWALNRGAVPSYSLDAQQFLFLSNGRYVMIDPVGDDEVEEGESPCGGAGLEYGSYSLVSGVFTASSIIADTNGCAGLHDMDNGQYKVFNPVSINGGTGVVTVSGDPLLVRTNPLLPVFVGEGEVVAATTGTPISQEGGAYEMYCEAPGTVGERFPLEASFTFDAVGGSFVVSYWDEGDFVESSGSYNATTGALSWQESEPRHVVMDNGEVVYFSEYVIEYNATYDTTSKTITGSWTDTVTTSWDRDSSEVSCTSDAEFSITSQL